jgi:hypothetical protein
MLAKTSKQSSDRTKTGRSLLAVLSVEGPKIAQLLVDLFSPHRLEGDPEPAFLGNLIAIGRKLKDAIDRVVSADNVLFAANAALDAARQRRDDHKQRLSRQVMSLRAACNALFVNLTVQHMGFDQRTAQDAAPLLIQADRIVEHFRGDDHAEAEYVFAGDDFDPKKYADQVAASAKELRDSLDDVAESVRHVEKTVQDKRALSESYDEIHLHGARIFESFCRLVGEDELADRVRPSEPRSARGQTEPETDGSKPAGPGEEDVPPAAVSEPAGAVVDQGRVEPWSTVRPNYSSSTPDASCNRTQARRTSRRASSLWVRCWRRSASASSRSLVVERPAA